MITALYAGLLGLLTMVLAFAVIRQRYRTTTALGDGNDFQLQRSIRAHANLVEYAPLFLILLALAETQGMAPRALYALGALFVVGRLLHAYSLLKAERYIEGAIQGFPIWRSSGMVCTFSTLAYLSMALILQFLSS